MPYPSVGHSAPFVQFAKHLARAGVAVSFMAPDAEISSFTHLLIGDAALEARHNITVVPFAFPIHQEEMDVVYFFSIRDWMQANAEKFHEIIACLDDAAAGPPVCIISDMFLGFTQVSSRGGRHLLSYATHPIRRSWRLMIAEYSGLLE